MPNGAIRDHFSGQLLTCRPSQTARERDLRADQLGSRSGVMKRNPSNCCSLAVVIMHSLSSATDAMIMWGTLRGGPPARVSEAICESSPACEPYVDLRKLERGRLEQEIAPRAGDGRAGRDFGALRRLCAAHELQAKRAARFATGSKDTRRGPDIMACKSRKDCSGRATFVS